MLSDEESSVSARLKLYVRVSSCNPAREKLDSRGGFRFAQTESGERVPLEDYFLYGLWNLPGGRGRHCAGSSHLGAARQETPGNDRESASAGRDAPHHLDSPRGQRDGTRAGPRLDLFRLAAAPPNRPKGLKPTRLPRSCHSQTPALSQSASSVRMTAIFLPRRRPERREGQDEGMEATRFLMRQKNG